MHSAEPPAYLTWLSMSFRWLAWFALGTNALLADVSDPWLWLFPVFALWYFLQGRLATTAGGTLPFRLLSVGADLLFADLLFLFGGAALSWAGMLPVFTAGLTFGTAGLGLAVLLSLAGLAIAQFLLPSSSGRFDFLALAAAIYLTTALLVLVLKPWLRQAIEKQQRGAGKVHQEALRAIDRRRRALFSLLTELSAASSSGRVYAAALEAFVAALDLVQPASPSLVGALWRLESGPDQGSQGRLVAARGLPGLDQDLALVEKVGLIGRALAEGELRCTEKIQGDPDLSRLPGLEASRSACAMRLEVGGEPGAVLLLAHPDPDFFTQERCEGLELVAGQAAIAIHQSDLLRKAVLEKERILEIEEEARRQLARDLHDGPTQSIAALAMRINFTRRMIDRDAQAAVEELVKVEELARKTTKEMRHLLFTLRPLVLESHGLAAALNALADKLQEAYHHTLVVSVDSALLPRVSMDQQSALFYLVEEAITQARKHAGAGRSWVRLEPLDSERVLLEIEDDGAPPTAEGNDRAPEALRERATLIGASLTVQARPGHGARLSLALQLAPTDPARIPLE